MSHGFLVSLTIGVPRRELIGDVITEFADFVRTTDSTYYNVTVSQQVDEKGNDNG